MDSKELAPLPQSSASSRARRRLPRFALLTALLVCGTICLAMRCMSGPDESKPEKKPEPIGAAWSYEAVFPSWPKDKKPDFAIIVTGQTYGYLQKCGCSDPQKGGLERRFNFIEGFKTHGIEPVPIDLGDVSPELSEDHGKILRKQALLKYQVAMRCMKAMGYRAVGLGKEEFALGLLETVEEFSGQPGNEQPRIVAANLAGYRVANNVETKATYFRNGNLTGSAIGDWEIIPTKSKISLGVLGIIGEALVEEVAGKEGEKPAEQAKRIDPKIVFAPDSGKVVADALTAMAKGPNPVELGVLLYAGPVAKAKRAAELFPSFRIIVCDSEEAEPPGLPIVVTDPKNPMRSTMIVRVGHKGQNVGVIGVFKNANGTFDLMYQKVTMSPEFETPAAQEKKNIALQELERYSKKVRDDRMLVQNRKTLHALQLANPDAKYVGSDNCMACHVAHDQSAAIWKESKHARAYASLETIAKKPSLRQFDGECIRCHTVGYDFKTGFVDADKTPLLKNVGCESCHGPGSQHSLNPKNCAVGA